MTKFLKGLLIVLLIAAAGFGYLSYRTDKPMLIHRGVTDEDLLNHVGSATHGERYANGTSMVQYEVIEDQVFKILHEGYPMRIKLHKPYTLTLYFDADGYTTGWEVKGNPNSPFLGKDRR